MLQRNVQGSPIYPPLDLCPPQCQHPTSLPYCTKTKKLTLAQFIQLIQVLPVTHGLVCVCVCVALQFHM